MSSRDFAYWLQGFFEINGNKNTTLSKKQVEMIRNHLALVFYHEIDPSYSKDSKVQEKMNEIHNGTTSPITQDTTPPITQESNPIVTNEETFPGFQDDKTVYRC